SPIGDRLLESWDCASICGFARHRGADWQSGSCEPRFTNRNSSSKAGRGMKVLIFLSVVAMAVIFAPPASAATSANANSPLGINLNNLSFYDPEQPFLNIFKTTGINSQGSPRAWSTRSKMMGETQEEAYLQLDS